MTTTSARLRPGRRDDAPAIQRLYREVGATPGGIARTPPEVTSDYVNGFVEDSLARGIILVAELPGLAGLAGELHAYRSDLEVFRHVMGDLTVAVHPRAQGQGIGRQLFHRLLAEVKQHHPDVTRVELITQEGNERALRLYESLGFRREGRLEGRIRASNGGYEADIPMAWYR
ncbi:MAG TPA: N-acetyltransferase [Gemmatimonadaceae bacterium]|nr:N-acetyltransferase [Gemmatimonadaceae bacterium]